MLPGSEQLRLQHKRAIETSGVLLIECAFLQQSGSFVIGHEPSCSCAPIPIALPVRAAISAKAVNHLRIVAENYRDGLFCLSRMGNQTEPNGSGLRFVRFSINRYEIVLRSVKIS